MSENKMEYVANQLKELEEFIKNSDACYDDLYENVDSKLDELRKYAEENDVPLMIDTDDLIAQHREEESYEEEYSSSYYDESYYDEEEEDED